MKFLITFLVFTNLSAFANDCSFELNVSALEFPTYKLEETLLNKGYMLKSPARYEVSVDLLDCMSSVEDDSVRNCHSIYPTSLAALVLANSISLGNHKVAAGLHIFDRREQVSVPMIQTPEVIRPQVAYRTLLEMVRELVSECKI